MAFVLSISFCRGVCSILIFCHGDFLGGVLYVSTLIGLFKSKSNGSLGPLTSTASTSSSKSPTSIAPWIL